MLRFSYGKSSAEPGSELDLLVTLDDETRLFDLVGLEQDLSDRFGIEVDGTMPASIKLRLRK